MAKLANVYTDIDLDSVVEFLVDGTIHQGRVVRVGNTRTWGHAISDLDNNRYEFDVSEEGFRNITP